MNNYQSITASPEALAAFLGSIPAIETPWDDAFHRLYCSSCSATDCDDCRRPERDSPLGEIIELAVLLDFAENILTIAPYAVVVIECHTDELKRNIVAICVEPLSALATVAGDLSTNGLEFLAFGALGLPAGG